MKAYAIKDPNGIILFQTIRITVIYCKMEFQYVQQMLWADIYMEGYRCVPVEITEIKSK